MSQRKKHVYHFGEPEDLYHVIELITETDFTLRFIELITGIPEAVIYNIRVGNSFKVITGGRLTRPVERENWAD